MSTTLLALQESTAKEIGYASGTCSAAGTTTTILDTSADSPMDTGDEDTQYKNAWVRIESDTAGTPLNVGETRRISVYAPSTQEITTSSAFTNATTITQSYGIFTGLPPTRLGLHKGIDEYINEVLRNVYYRTLHLLTLITDGDMETSGVSDWVMNGATRSKVTSIAMLGKQALQVDNSGANGYVRPALVDVSESQVYELIAECKVTTGTAKLQLYDETNGAEIESDTSKETDWRYLYFQEVIPADCKRVSVRLIGVESTAIVTWDNVTLRNANARRIDLPTWLANPTALEDVFAWGGGSAGTTEDSLAVDERYAVHLPWFEVIHDTTGLNPYRLEFAGRPGPDQHLVMRALRSYAELSATTDTTDANADLVRAGALARIYSARELKDVEKAAYWTTEYARLLRQYQPRLSKRILRRPY